MRIRRVALSPDGPGARMRTLCSARTARPRPSLLLLLPFLSSSSSSYPQHLPTAQRHPPSPRPSIILLALQQPPLTPPANPGWIVEPITTSLRLFLSPTNRATT
ncbi:hypothetical protein BO70DRAFT_18460 [Aspergillus heteromorphus CBS 117.55]|uniref:Uncharacterized protein n=1 Tax=Aspergillus heteromorphus CBS 117.55 TaxID=1448321 RepID=A0A317X7A5_9EURO|nr:uncharacterized protein BO70DRAFT_18460 [Aspergillus heteromorphus CBS 117.55]PWY92758.1 hypothetical protein BO70DRAFT_18460 [Aspergillus heteromorphus CBS 117.55]